MQVRGPEWVLEVQGQGPEWGRKVLGVGGIRSQSGLERRLVRNGGGVGASLARL